MAIILTTTKEFNTDEAFVEWVLYSMGVFDKLFAFGEEPQWGASADLEPRDSEVYYFYLKEPYNTYAVPISQLEYNQRNYRKMISDIPSDELFGYVMNYIEHHGERHGIIYVDEEVI